MRKLIVVVVVLAGACKGKSEDSKQPPVAESKPAETKPAETKPAEAPPPAPADDASPPCKLLTRDEVAKLIGEDVKNVSGGGGICTIEGAHPNTHNVVIRYITDDAAKEYDENHKVDVTSPDDKDVRGVGTKAYRRASGLSFGILANNKYVNVFITTTEPPPSTAALEATMKTIASRM